MVKKVKLWDDSENSAYFLFLSLLQGTTILASPAMESSSLVIAEEGNLSLASLASQKSPWNKIPASSSGKSCSASTCHTVNGVAQATIPTGIVNDSYYIYRVFYPRPSSYW